MESPVAIIGAGIIGLTTAVELQRHGHEVIVVADRFSPDTTSDVAAAVWYPYAVSPRDLALEWSRVAFRRFEAESQSLPNLVSMVEFHELFREPVGDAWWGVAVDGYRHLDQAELPAGYADGYAAFVPIIESTPYLQHLQQVLRSGGASFKKLPKPIKNFSELAYDHIVNCCGFGAVDLCADTSMYPMRGQVLRVSRIEGISKTYADDTLEDMPTYIVPRLNDCVLGGTATKEVDVAPRLVDSTSIVSRCSAIEPALSAASVLEVKVGIRPGRPSIRLEREQRDGKVIVHNYGHGGAGFTLCWGTAERARELLAESLS